jgi:hypothetical protein
MADERLEEMLGRIIADAINEQLAPLRRRIESLEARSDVELRYCGVWQDQKYERGNFVTLDGGLWHAQMTTTSRPGNRVACDRGRCGLGHSL